MYQLLIALCAGIFVSSMILGVWNGKLAESMAVRQRLEKIRIMSRRDDMDLERKKESFSQRVILPASEKIVHQVAILLPINEKTQDRLKKQLILAGSSIQPREYVAISVITVVCMALAGPYIASVMGMQVPVIFAMFFGAYAGFAMRRFSMSSAITRRKQKIEKELPNIIDLLSVSTTSGLGFDQALVYVTDRCAGVFVDELRLMQQQLLMGRSKRDAMKSLTERCETDEVSTFVSALLQAEEVGISMQNILNTQSAAIRQSHKHKVEEQAAKLPVKILLPIVLFIFPVLFIILLGPIVPSLMEMF